MINQVTLVGTVKQEPRSAANGALLNFSILTWSHGRDGKRWDTTHFVDVSAKRDIPPLDEGQLVAITGTINRRSYEKNGEKVWMTTILAFNITMADTGQEFHSSDIRIDRPPSSRAACSALGKWNTDTN